MEKKPRRKNSAPKNLEKMDTSIPFKSMAASTVFTMGNLSTPSINGHDTSVSSTSLPGESCTQTAAKPLEDPIESRRQRNDASDFHESDAKSSSPSASLARGSSASTNGVNGVNPGNNTKVSNTFDPQKRKSSVARAGITKYRTLSGKAAKTVYSSNSSAIANANDPNDNSSSRRLYTTGSSKAIASDDGAFEKGLELLEKKLFPQAMACFSEVLRLQPTKLKAFIYRGDCYFHLQQYDQAIDDFTQIIEKTPGEPRLFAKRANAYAKRKKFKEAVADFSKALSHSVAAHTNTNERRDLLIARARVFEEMNSCPQALEDLANAQELDDRCEAIYELRARLYQTCDNHDLAVEALNKVIELQLCHDRSPCENIALRAQLLMKIAEQEAQISQEDMQLLALEEGVSREPSCFNEEVVRKAIDDYSFLLQHDPTDTHLLKQRSQAFLAINLLQEAEWDLDKAARLDPEDFGVRMTRARLLRRVDGHAIRAIEQVSQVLDTNGFFVDALLLRAKFYEEARLFGKAVDDYTAIIDCEYDGNASARASSMDQDQEQELVVVVHEEASGRRHRFTQSNSSNSSVTSTVRTTLGGFGTASASGRIMSEVTVEALMARARVYMHHLKEYENAIKDYELIVASTTNMVDAQLELKMAENFLQEQAKERAKQAMDWLLEQEDGNGANGASGHGNLDPVGWAAAGGATPSSQRKKKKKKKKKKQKNGVNGGKETEKETDITPLRAEEDEDEDEDENENENENENGDNIKILEEQADEHQHGLSPTDTDTEITTTMREQEESPELPVHDDDAEEPQPSPPVSPPHPKTSPQETPLSIRIPMICTRDEACESMIESAMQDQTEQGIGLNAPSTEPNRTTSSTTETNAPKASPRGILMDEKYLRKRKKQMEKLRSDLKQFCEANSAKDLAEVLDRIERKNMADQLGAEMQHAKAVLQSLRDGSVPLLNTNQEQPDGVTELSQLQDQTQALKASKTPLSSQFPSSTCTTLMTVPQSPGGGRLEANKPSSGLPIKSVEQPDPVDVYERFHGSKNGLELRIDTGLHKVVGPEPSPIHDENKHSTFGNNKVLSLYRKPIDYGSALRAKIVTKDHSNTTNKPSDDSSNLLLQKLKEKDAQVEALRRLLLSGVAAASWDITKLSDVKLSDNTENMFQSSPSDSETKFESLRRLFRSDIFVRAANSAVCLRINELLEWIGPTLESEQVRHKVLSYVQFVLEKHFQRHVPIIATGSFPMKTYLPNADIDASILLPPDMEHTWHLAVTQALCLAATHEINGSQPMRSPYMKSAPAFGGVSNSPLRHDAMASATSNMLKSCAVRNVSFINAEVRVVKCTIDNVAVDLTANRFGAMGALLLLHEVDRLVGQDHLFKKSLVLIKAWCAYESSVYFPLQALGASQSHSQPMILGASGGSLSTYALNTMVMALFNRHAAVIKHPLQALFLFLDMFADFAWHEFAVSIHGPVSLVSIGSFPTATTSTTTTTSTNDASATTSSNLMSPQAVDTIRSKVTKLTAGVESAASASAALFPFQVRVCNVIDPLNERNNIARSVTPEALPNIRRAFVLGRNRLCELLVMASLRVDGVDDSDGLDERRFMHMDRSALDEFFTSCWKHYGKGDGWRPDLLVHPRQVWHGSPVGTTLAKEQEREKKWQSFLPERLFE